MGGLALVAALAVQAATQTGAPPPSPAAKAPETAVPTTHVGQSTYVDLEAGAGYGNVAHGTAVALGLLAALRLSGRATDVVERILEPEPVRADRDRAWAALQRDKKRGLVLLGEDGPRWGVQLPDSEVRGALDELIAD